MARFHISNNILSLVRARKKTKILLLAFIVSTTIFATRSLSNTKIISSQLAYHRMISYFNLNGDASLVKWSHGVNSKDKLISSLESDSNFLEADILKIDHLHAEPIMAHPPQTSSDLTFTQWLHLSKSSKKGLKLDFKTWNSVEPCLSTILSTQSQITTPVILNADVFQGVNAPAAKIDPHLFINKSLEFYPSGVLSLGWTTTNNQLGQYAWSDVYEAFQILNEKNILHSKDTEVTFAVRLLWSANSINRLLWLQKMTGCSLTLWSHSTDRMDCLDPLLLFRKYFHPSSVYYDLQPEESQFFLENVAGVDRQKLDKRLSESKNELVRAFMKAEKFIDENKWNKISGVFYQSDFGALMLQNGATFSSKKQYRVNGTEGIYEFIGSFEMFPIKNGKNSTTDTESNNFNSQKFASNITEDFDNNIDLGDRLSENCVRISLRSSDSRISEKPYANPAGSVNVYIFPNGLIRVYNGESMQQEANLQAAKKIEFSVTDVGDSGDLHIDLNSWDSDFNKLSLQLLLPCKYAERQEFYSSITLVGHDYAVGVNSLRILNEIQDPQDRDNNKK